MSKPITLSVQFTPSEAMQEELEGTSPALLNRMIEHYIAALLKEAAREDTVTVKLV